jgi:hypothetical protein
MLIHIGHPCRLQQQWEDNPAARILWPSILAIKCLHTRYDNLGHVLHTAGRITCCIVSRRNMVWLSTKRTQLLQRYLPEPFVLLDRPWHHLAGAGCRKEERRKRLRAQGEAQPRGDLCRIVGARDVVEQEALWDYVLL